MSLSSLNQEVIRKSNKNFLIYSIFKEFSFYLSTKFKRCGFTVPRVYTFLKFSIFLQSTKNLSSLGISFIMTFPISLIIT